MAYIITDDDNKSIVAGSMIYELWNNNKAHRRTPEVPGPRNDKYKGFTDKMSMDVPGTSALMGYYSTDYDDDVVGSMQGIRGIEDDPIDQESLQDEEFDDMTTREAPSASDEGYFHLGGLPIPLSGLGMNLPTNMEEYYKMQDNITKTATSSGKPVSEADMVRITQDELGIQKTVNTLQTVSTVMYWGLIGVTALGIYKFVIKPKMDEREAKRLTAK